MDFCQHRGALMVKSSPIVIAFLLIAPLLNFKLENESYICVQD